MHHGLLCVHFFDLQRKCVSLVTWLLRIIHHSSNSTVLRFATLFIKIHTHYYFLLMQFTNAEISRKVNKEV